MKRLTKAQKQRKLRRALKTTIWYAACEDGHPFWSGPDRDTSAKAQSDADTHDRKVHNDGQSHAVVLPGN
jgi:hypothetical protein